MFARINFLMPSLFIWALLFCTGSFATTVTSLNNASLSVSFNTINSWAGGYQGEVVIRNTSNSTVMGWQLTFESGANIDNIWNANVSSHSGSSFVIAPAPWTTAVPANSRISFGYVASGPTEITQITLIDPNKSMDVVVPAEPTPETTFGADEQKITVTTPSVYNGFGPSLNPVFNYGEALQQSWYFYEAQRSGPLPKADGDLSFIDPRRVSSCIVVLKPTVFRGVVIPA